MKRLFALVTVITIVQAGLPAPAHAQGGAWSFGNNVYGQLGNGTKVDSNVPLQGSGFTEMVSVGRGWLHSLAIKSDGTVWTWGDNEYGQLGNGTKTDSTVPVKVSGLTGVTATTGGYYHSLALKSDGTVWAWGYNGYYQLGNNTQTDSSVPVQVTGLSGVLAVASGETHCLALKSDGTVWAWGRNIEGELGNGSTNFTKVPVQVSGLTGVVSVACGTYHSLAVKNDGTVWDWGVNSYGQLGNGTRTGSTLPLQVNGLTGAAGVAGGGNHSLAFQSDGTVWAWGANGGGQLGNGTNTDSWVPVQVSGLTGVVSIAAGVGNCLAAKIDGTAWAWGANNYGQLGNGANTNTTAPVRVSGLTSVTAVACGFWHCLAIGTFAPSNTPPVADSQTVLTKLNTSVPVTLTATDAEGDVLTYSVVDQPLHGALSGSPPNLTYTPTTGFVGVDTFTFKANDGTADSNIATVTIRVRPIPKLVLSSLTGYIGKKATLSATLTDPAGNIPIPGKSIAFEVTPPGGSPLPFTLTATSSPAKASFNVTEDWSLGTGKVVATFAGDSDWAAPAPAEKPLVIAKGPVRITVKNVAGYPGVSTTLSATLTNYLLQPLVGRTLNFDVAGTGVGSAITDSFGHASVPYTFGATPGKYVVTVTFSGDAMYASGLKSGNLVTVNPIGVKSVRLSASSVKGGNSVTGTVFLQSAAFPGVVTVTMASSDTSLATVAPITLDIPAGASSGTFTVNTTAVAVQTTVTISATANGVTKSVTLTVKP